MTDDLVALVKQAEGLRLKAYICPAGYPTIGYGHRVDSLSHPPVTEAEAEEMLRADLAQAEAAALLLAPALTGPRLAALTDLIYNVGANAIKGSGVLRCLNAGDWPGAAARFRQWNKARVNGQLTPLPGLTKRREVGARWIEEG